MIDTVDICVDVFLVLVLIVWIIMIRLDTKETRRLTKQLKLCRALTPLPFHKTARFQAEENINAGDPVMINPVTGLLIKAKGP